MRIFHFEENEIKQVNSNNSMFLQVLTVPYRTVSFRCSTVRYRKLSNDTSGITSMYLRIYGTVLTCIHS